MARRKKKAAHSMGEVEAPEEEDMSRAGSFRRLADVFRASAAWDIPTAADALDEEADLLDPPKEEEKDEETTSPA
jgi:hypothetical protein